VTRLRGTPTSMAGRKEAQSRSKRRRGKRVSRPKRRLRLLWVVVLVGVVAYLYYQPLTSYVETRRDLAARRAEVAQLRATKAELEQRLESWTSLDATRREARRIGYVLPGERLFVVKGIPDWRKARRNLREDG
jgi:cell division protein FtsB